ncbi:hypothetical protein AAFC00_000526 [Neodothiora populina]|uniref:GED domain-containing protein n=1 Tax=Neodothiora populina TaxID=2781224 RepID=A0ABR3PD59_9PEZI
MESDMANSRASKIVEDCAGAKERCVGVLTKPDRRPADSQFEDVRKVLAGQTFTVGHGYFVAMQPSQLMLDTGISADEARLQEAHFFAQEPWSNTLKDFQHRFGTSQLQIALSRKLADQIRKSLPDISDRIDARLAHVDLDLQNYPDPPANALGHIIEALTLFKTSTERHLEGSFPHNEFRNDVKKVAVSFREALKDLKPTLKVATPEGFLPNGPAATVNLLSEDEDEDMNDIASHEGRHTPCAVATSTPTSNKKRKVDIESSSATDRLKMLNMRSNPRPKFKEIAQRVFTLMEIRSTLENLTMSDIPGEIDPRAVDHLRSECLTGWKGPMDKFLHDIAIILKDKLGQVFHETCGKWSATEFYRETKKMVDSFIDVTMSEERAHACRALQLELFKPLTLNNEDIDKKQKEELERIEAVRYRKRAIEYLDRTEQRTGRITSGADRSKKIQNDKTLRMSLGADVFQKEIEVMSRVCGYYRVAMFRFLDRVVQETQHGLEQCRSGLHQQLLLGLEIGNENAHEHCTRLLLEDPLREAQRIALKNERQKLVEAQERLSRLDIPEIE